MQSCQNCPNAGKTAFCDLGCESRAFLEANSIPMEYQRGNILFREGDPCAAILMVCSGRVKISTTSREGRTLILRIASAGHVLGLGSALNEEEHEVTAEAMEPCHVRVLPMKRLQELMKNADAGLSAARAMAADYRATFDETRRIALSGTPAGRLARLILDWSAEARERDQRSFVTMPLTHEELASMTATTRETVTRTLGRFRKEKLIQTRGVALTVLQPRALEMLSAC